MYIFNTTFVCDDSRMEEFLMCVNAEFIPKLVASGIANEPQLAHVVPVKDSDDDEAASFSLQVKIDNVDLLEKWMKEDFYPSIADMSKRFGDKVLYFPTILEVLPINSYN